MDDHQQFVFENYGITAKQHSQAIIEIKELLFKQLIAINTKGKIMKMRIPISQGNLDNVTAVLPPDFTPKTQEDVNPSPIRFYVWPSFTLN